MENAFFVLFLRDPSFELQPGKGQENITEVLKLQEKCNKQSNAEKSKTSYFPNPRLILLFLRQQKRFQEMKRISWYRN